LIGAAALLVFMFVGTATASGAAAVKLPVLQNNTRTLNNYLAEVKQSGMVNMQTNDQPKRPPAIDMDNLYQDEEAAPTERKSVFKAFVYSAVVPGAGQLYTGSKVKAAAFFGVEVATWAGYIVFHGKGNDKTDVFNAFADEHWSDSLYGNFLEDNYGVRDDDLAKDESGNLIFTHHLPDTKTQQYYEMIGKYNQFVFGWDDVDPSIPRIPDNLGTAYSAHREQYETMRHDANVMYGRATASLIVMMANHVISGAEAALAARNHNKKVQAGEQRLSFRAVTATINRTSFPMLTMTYKF
jgi:hypothetical protein